MRPFRIATQIDTDFQFHPLFDHDFLMDFFENNLEEISWAFQTFYNMTLSDFFQLLPNAYNNNWQRVKELAHQLKSNFKLVGLNSLYSDLHDIEMNIEGDENNYTKELNRILILDEKMRLQYIPIIKQEMLLLKNRISLNS